MNKRRQSISESYVLSADVDTRGIFRRQTVSDIRVTPPSQNLSSTSIRQWILSCHQSSGREYCPTCCSGAFLSCERWQESADECCSVCDLVLKVTDALLPGWRSASENKLALQTDFIEGGDGEAVRNNIISDKKTAVLDEETDYVKLQLRPGNSSLPEHIINICLSIMSSSHSLPSQAYPLKFAPRDPILFIIVKHLMEKCIQNHVQCTSEGTDYMPRRLLDVSAEDPFLTEGCDSAPYVALSYCWGTFSGALVTTQENYSRHRKCIPLASMPKTLQDAVWLTKALGFRYLWADALCIVQDEPGSQDWYKESGKMLEIYSNSTITIAADISESSAYGFIGEYKDHIPAWQIIVDLPMSSSKAIGTRTGLSSIHRPDSYGIVYQFHDRPLSRRGWALQEGILPMHVLHFTGLDVSLECNAGAWCSYKYKAKSGSENYPIWNLSRRLSPVVHGRHGFSGNTKVYNIWQHIVSEFCGRDLTLEADKLPALSGLARIIQQNIKLDTAAG